MFDSNAGGLFDENADDDLFDDDEYSDEDELEEEEATETPAQDYAAADQVGRAPRPQPQRPYAGAHGAPPGNFQDTWIPYQPRQAPMDYPYSASAGVSDFIEPRDTSPEAAMRTAGFTVLFVAVSAGVGYAVKGGLGAVTGLLGAGAVANGYRAQKWWGSADPSEKHEAVVSGLFAFAGGAAAAYLGYKAATMEK